LFLVWKYQAEASSVKAMVRPEMLNAGGRGSICFFFGPVGICMSGLLFYPSRR